MELQNIERLAVFKMRNIGDVLMITPVLRALRETFPRARITVVVNSGTEPMLAHNPDVDEVLVFERSKRKRSLGKRLRYEFFFARELYKRRFDLTIGFTEGDRAAWYSLFCGARYRLGSAHYTWSRYDLRRRAYNLPTPSTHAPVWMHEVEKHFWKLERAGLTLSSTTPGDLRLDLPDHLRDWARKKIEPLRPARIVHVHPVARWLRKCWNDESMARVIDWLQEERGARVVVTTGPIPRERERAKKIVALCRSNPIFYDGVCTLSELGALTAEADCFLGVDTAPMHIAAAVGTPVIALFGPTGMTDWRPWHAQGRVLSHGCACKTELKDLCASDPNQPRACMEAITVAEVQAALDEVLVK